MKMIAILHNIRSLHNVGSIFRTADGAGVSKIYLTGYSPAPTDRFGNKRKQLTKVSLGAEDSVPWEKQNDITKLINNLRAERYKIFAVEQHKNSVPYNTPSLSPPILGGEKTALIVGNEIRGLSAVVLKQADQIVEIPMRGKKESLNVAVAFGIAAYHFINITPPLPSPSRSDLGTRRARGGQKRKVI